VIRANHDALPPRLRVSSGSFDFVTIQNDPKIIDKLHNLQILKTTKSLKESVEGESLQYEYLNLL
jgi:hypothetical protein